MTNPWLDSWLFFTGCSVKTTSLTWGKVNPFNGSLLGTQCFPGPKQTEVSILGQVILYQEETDGQYTKGDDRVSELQGKVGGRGMKAEMLRMLGGKELQCEVRFPGKLAKEGLKGVRKQLYSFDFAFFLCGDP